MAVAKGDFNGDGKLDVAVAISGGVDLIAILYGGTNGLQFSRQFSSAGVGVSALAVADLNRDGIADLIALNGSSGTIAVFLGQGQGVFRQPVTYPVGSVPSSFAVGDLGTGKLDIVVSHFGGLNTRTLGVLRGFGDGSFQPLSDFTLPAGSIPALLTLADVNGDGKLDLVGLGPNTFVPFTVPGPLVVMLGSGNGSFQAPMVTSLDQLAASIQVADLNGDGKPDLILANTGPVTIRLGNGDGTFQSGASFGGSTASLNGLATLVADFNGDNKPDIAGLVTQTGDAFVLLNARPGQAPWPVHDCGTVSDGPVHARNVSVAVDYGRRVLLVVEAGG